MTIFDPASLHHAVGQALISADIPADKSNAFVLVATPAGVKAVLAVKVNDMWQVDAMVSTQGTSIEEAGISVRASW